MWGSVSPDVLPQYKIKRHYYQDSIDFVILKIAKLIFLNRFLDFRKCDYAALKLFSTDIGVISHYLSDYACIAHAENWAMPKNLVKHLNYEKELNDLAKTYDFKNTINLDRPEIKASTNELSTVPVIKTYVSESIGKYLENQRQEFQMNKDLDYALALNIGIFEYIIETILVNSSVLEPAY